ncbi:virulence plasmid 28 protein [Shewanella psychrophila]|uniref:Virulence plasmid 28 protein n=1 Tax=Shewanella psychrophila TaxID=225848 RepID=A0A1S6HU29_9GAMM|nr:Tc toxin subunit A [Shewanella psychrophila]AQS38989.1 virulence plasmid 28 protein [Shewanella psychrophila]
MSITDTKEQDSNIPASSLLKRSSLNASNGPTPSAEQLIEDAHFLDTLASLGQTSIFDITRLSRSRFIRRYDRKLDGSAGEIYDRATNLGLLQK